jgi:hypothetical protein
MRLSAKQMAIEWRHENKLAEQYAQQAERRTRSAESVFRWPIHRTHFRGYHLLFIGYELNVCREEGMGFGLKTNVLIPSGRPITQYEGIVCTKHEADIIREGQHGKILASWFASTHLKGFVINGLCLHNSPTPDPSPGKSRGTPIARHELLGYGGGSFCNHSFSPNAKFVRCSQMDGLGLFVCSIMDILPGSFIHVNYGTSFLASKWSNM